MKAIGKIFILCFFSLVAGSAHAETQFTDSGATAIFNAGGGQTEWHDLSWLPARPAGKLLPENSSTNEDNIYQAAGLKGGVDMGENFLYLHLNDPANATTFSNKASGGLEPACTNCPVVGLAGSGKFGSGANFNKGNSQCINVGNARSFVVGARGLTISAWIKPASFPPAGDNIQMIAAISLDSAKQSALEVGLYSDQGIFRMAARSMPTDRKFLYSTQSLSLSAWHHVVAVADYANDRQVLYMDGNKVGSGSLNFTNSQVAVDSAVSATKASIGGEDDCLTAFFDGGMDEVAFWNRALSDREVYDIYRRYITKLQLQVRACALSDCSDSGSAIVFDEASNVGGALPLFAALGLEAKQYFKYQVVGTSEQEFCNQDDDEDGVAESVSCKPSVGSVSVSATTTVPNPPPPDPTPEPDPVPAPTPVPVPTPAPAPTQPPPPTVTLQISGAVLGEDVGGLIVSATLSSVSNQDCTVQLGFTGTASEGNDFEATSQAILIPAGQISGSLTLQGKSDQAVEGGESIIVNVLGTSDGCAVRTTQKVQALLSDNDQPKVEKSSAKSGGGIYTVTCINLLTNEECGSTVSDAEGNYSLEVNREKAVDPNDSTKMRIVVRGIQKDVTIEKYYETELTAGVREFQTGSADMGETMAVQILKKELGNQKTIPVGLAENAKALSVGASMTSSGFGGAMAMARENLECLMANGVASSSLGFEGWNEILRQLVVGVLSATAVDRLAAAGSQYCNFEADTLRSRLGEFQDAMPTVGAIAATQENTNWVQTIYSLKPEDIKTRHLSGEEIWPKE